jgi:hypothetical protein
MTHAVFVVDQRDAVDVEAATVEEYRTRRTGRTAQPRGTFAGGSTGQGGGFADCRSRASP